VIYGALGPYRKLHPCIKTVEEMVFIVESLTDKGQVVLDCCCGLGSTLLAAQQLGRRWIGCDISRKYCQITLRRLKKEVFDGHECEDDINPRITLQ
jgi:DNA modification methylase